MLLAGWPACRYSWRWGNLLLGCDSTRGLLEPLAKAMALQLPASLPAMLPLGGLQQEAAMGQHLGALFQSLSADKAMCCVSWSRGRVSITVSDRFSSVFLDKAGIEDGVLLHATSPLHVWAR